MAADTVEVRVDPPYPVTVGEDAIGGIPEKLDPRPCAILTDGNVGPLHAETLERSLRAAGWPVLGTVEVPAGGGAHRLWGYADGGRGLAREGPHRGGGPFVGGGGGGGGLGGFPAAT